MDTALDGIRQKLEVNNLVIKNQAIAKLSRLLKVRLKQNKVINDKCPELDLIWDKSCDVCPLISDGMCRILVSIVVSSSGQADLYNYIMNGLTIRIPSSRNANSLIMAVKDLLIFQLFKENPIKYNLRSPVHPFIHILRNRPSILPLLYDKIKSIFNENAITFRDAFDILKPFFRYVFFDPSPSNLLSEFRTLLFGLLLSKCKTNGDKELMAFLFQSPFWIQSECIEGALETYNRLREMSNIVMESSISEEKIELRAGNLFLCLVSHCYQMNRLGLDIESCLSIVEKLTEKQIGFISNPFCESAIVLLGSLIMEISPFSQRRAIRICFFLLSEKKVSTIISGFLYLPLITILSISDEDIKTRIPLSLLYNSQPQAIELLHLIENNINIDSEFEPYKKKSRMFFAATNFNVYAFESYHIFVLAQEVIRCTLTTIRWLEHLKEVMSNGRILVTPVMISLLCSLAVRSRNIHEIELCVDVITLVAMHDVDHASGLFPFMLYLLKHKTDPTVCILIYKAITCYGKHKVCVAPILRFLSTLFEVTELRGFSLRLMCFLWQKQDRVYPHLQKWLVDDTMTLPLCAAKEVAVAKAASILDVCRLKPKQYGADLLTTLSKIVSSEKTVDGSTVSALAIDSITTLCKQEVIDLRTTWMFLVRVIGNDERAIVLEKLCELLSLVEVLALENFTYKQFLAEVTSWLWHHACHFGDSHISVPAFEALCHFNVSCHQLKHLPVIVKERTKIPKEFRSKDSDVKPEDVIPYVPGSSYVDLLMTVPVDVLPGCGKFFVALVRREVENMPHYILHKSRMELGRQTVTTNCLPFVEEAKKFLTDNNFSDCPPELRSTVALGLLISFDPPRELNKDGNTTLHSDLKRGSLYRTLLNSCLSNAQMDLDDWRQCLCYLRAWASFMEKAYHAFINWRIVQIDIHLENATFAASLSEDPKILKNNAWLWARDKITDALKEVSRGKPTVHDNCVVALAGLSGAVVKYFIANGDFDDGSGMSEHLAHRHWMHDLCKAFLRILNPVDEPASGTFGWSVTSAHSNSHIQGLLAVLLADILIGMDVDLVRDILLSLHKRLLTDLSLTGQFYLGVGIGILLAQLISKNYVDLHGLEAKQLVLETSVNLKNWCFTEDFHSKHGALVGLAFVSTTLALEEDETMREFSISVKREFTYRLKNEPLSSLTYGILCFGCSLLFTTDSQYVEDAHELYCKLEKDCDELPNFTEVATSRGLLLQYLANTKPELYNVKHDDLFKTWTSTFTQSTSEVSKLPALVGTYWLVFGNYQIRFIQGSQRNLASNVDSIRLKELISNVMQLLKSNEENLSIRSNGIWILSSLVLCLDEMEEFLRPSCELSFLDDRSVLKYSVDFVQNFITSNQKGEFISRLLVCLRSLACETSRPYPAINWNRLLPPLLHLSTEVQELCIEIAVRRSSSSPSASMFLTSVMIGLASVSLKEASRIRLYHELPVTLHCITAKTWHLFLERNLTLLFKRRPTSLDAITPFVKGVAAAIKVPDPPAEVVQVLYIILASIFNHLDSEEKVAWDIFCESCWELPDDILDQMPVLTSENCLKVLLFRCSFVSSGKQSVTWLNDGIDVVATSIHNIEDMGKVLTCILKCFRAYSSLEVTPDCLDWFLEFMGHLRNVIGGHSRLPTKDVQHLTSVVTNLFLMFAASVMGWSQSPFLFCCGVCSSDCVGDKLLCLLPATLKKFLSQLNWTPHLHKVVDFLIAVILSSVVAEDVKYCSKECLLNLREFEAFRSASVWTRVIDLL